MILNSTHKANIEWNRKHLLTLYIWETIRDDDWSKRYLFTFSIFPAKVCDLLRLFQHFMYIPCGVI